MTVPAFSPSVVLPGAPPASLGVGGDVSASGTGVFEGLLAGLTGPARGEWPATGDQDDAAPSTDATLTDAAGLDPSLVQMFAPLGLLSATPVPPPAATDAAPTSGAAGGRWRFGDGDTPIPTALAAAGGRLDAGSSAEVDQAAASLNDRPISSVGPERSTPWTLPDRPAAPQPATAPAPAPIIPAAIAAATPVVTAQAAAAVETPAVPPPPKAGSADGEARRLSGAARTDRRDPAGRSGPAATRASAPETDALAANAATSAKSATGDGAGDADQPLDLAAADAVESPEARLPAGLAETRAQTAATLAEPAPRGSPETVARLAADIVRKVEGQSTRFDLQLDPHGLGKVDVAIEIDRNGRLTAAMSFESAQSAADLRGRAGELRLALEQAGFDIAEGGLTFDLSGQSAGFGGRETGQQDRAWNGRAFQRAQTGADEADLSLTDTPSTLSRRTRSGVDIRV